MNALMEHYSSLLETGPQLAVFLQNALAAFVILVIGFWIARWLRKKIRGAAFGTDDLVDNTLRPVIASGLYYLIIAITLYAVLRQLGVEATGLLAVFGAAGLAIGLALKDTLGNIAAGFMLLILRPLNVGEYIETPSANGSVVEVGLFATTIRNPEGVLIFVPNGQIWANRIQNYARHTERKLIIDIGIGYDADLKKAQSLLERTMRDQKFVQTTPEEPHVLVNGFGEYAITLSCRAWLPAEDWAQNSSDMRLAIKTALDKAGINVPYPQRIIRNVD